VCHWSYLSAPELTMPITDSCCASAWHDMVWQGMPQHPLHVVFIWYAHFLCHCITLQVECYQNCRVLALAWHKLIQAETVVVLCWANLDIYMHIGLWPSLLLQSLAGDCHCSWATCCFHLLPWRWILDFRCVCSRPSEPEAPRP